MKRGRTEVVQDPSAVVTEVPCVFNWKTKDGTRRGLILKVGQKYIHLILMDNPLRVRKVPHAEFEFMNLMPWYPVKKAARHFKHAARAWGPHGGVSKKAKRIIRELKV